MNTQNILCQQAIDSIPNELFNQCLQSFLRLQILPHKASSNFTTKEFLFYFTTQGFHQTLPYKGFFKLYHTRVLIFTTQGLLPTLPHKGFFDLQPGLTLGCQLVGIQGSSIDPFPLGTLIFLFQAKICLMQYVNAI